MKISINMSGGLFDIDISQISKWKIVSERKIGGKYFMVCDNGSCFSCCENSWREYRIHNRNIKINQIIQK